MTIEQQKKTNDKTNQLPKDTICSYLSNIAKKANAFFMLWISMVLMYGVVCNYSNEFGQDEFYRFIFFLQHPIVIFLNILSLFFALFHTITYFYCISKTTLLIKNSSKLTRFTLYILLWIVMISVSITLVLMVLGYFK